MKIQTQYTYEKKWTDTTEKELLKIIEEEIGDADPKGVLAYITETVKDNRVVSVNKCRFRMKNKQISDN